MEVFPIRFPFSVNSDQSKKILNMKNPLGSLTLKNSFYRYYVT